MDRKEREKLQNMIRQNFKGQEFLLQNLTEAKNTFRAKVAEINSQQGKMYTPEFATKEINRHRNAFRAVMDETREKILERLEELRYLLTERDQVIDLDNPALSNALLILQTGGRNLGLQERQRIEQNFAQDQSSLQTLRAIYQSQGISTSSIDRMIYNANETIDGLKTVATQVLAIDGEYDGNLNRYASRLAVIANIEGIAIEKTPDEIGVIEATRRAANIELPLDISLENSEKITQAEVEKIEDAFRRGAGL